MVSYGYGLMDHGSPKSPVVLVFSTQTAIDTELIELTESLGSGVATTHVA